MIEPIMAQMGVMPVLGRVDIQALIALVFVLVSVISYIVRTVQGNNQRMPPPVQRPGRRRDERVNDEIENFLQNVNRGGSEVKRPPEAVRAQESRSKSPPKRSQEALSQKPTAKAAPGRADIGSRSVAAASDLGGGLKQHLREHMAERVLKEAQRDVGQGVSESVQKHLGTTSRALSGSSSPQRVTTAELFAGETAEQAAAACCEATRAESLKKMLRSPDSMRQAIIIQEVLNRPKCLR